MGKATVYIDGEAGTTGLQIREWLAARDDIEILLLGDERRRDLEHRRRALNEADVSILCLPDDAAREAVSMLENPEARVIDASTAHRVTPGWAYGFPEMTPEQPEMIATAQRVSNPGCYPQGPIALLRPLIEDGLVPADYPVTINAVSGYTGGGKALIARYEDPEAQDYAPDPFWLYGLTLAHKHVPEFQAYTHLTHTPIFVPSVANYAQGMLTSIPLHLWSLPNKPTPAAIHGMLTKRYAGQRFVSVAPLAETEAMKDLHPEALNGTNDLRLHVFANANHDQVVLVAQYDNLGKGASGAAVQNLNLMLGLEESAGLEKAA